MSIVTVLIILALLLTVGILITGLVTMEQGGKLDERMSGKLMYARVAAQGVVIVLLLIALLIDKA